MNYDKFRLFKRVLGGKLGFADLFLHGHLGFDGFETAV